jgi:hypothetical protein
MDFGRTCRITFVTAMLMAVGFVVGLFIGGLSLPLIGLLRGGLEEVQDMLHFVGPAAIVGALLGAFLAPIVGWLLLRNVPLGRAVGYSGLSTLSGVVLAAFIGPFDVLGPFWPLILGFSAFLAAALLLHDRYLLASPSRQRTSLRALEPRSDISTPAEPMS